MRKITFFAGAGFSREVSERVKYQDDPDKKLKMPLASEMFNNKSSRDYLREDLSLGEYRFLGDYLVKKTGCRFPRKSYEEIYQNIIDDPNLTNSKKEKLKKLIEEMVFEILGNNFPPIRYQEEAKQTIRIIREVISKNKITDIVTTNPDILIETAIAGCTKYDDIDFGANIEIMRTEFTPVLDKKVINSKNEIDIKKIVKLHGSVLFIRDSQHNKVYIIDKYEWKKGASIQKFKNEVKKHIERTIRHIVEDINFCVIPPLNDKSKEYKEKEPWKRLFKDAKDLIKKSKKVIIFGFGFSENDKALKELFKEIDEETEIEIYDKRINDKEFKESVKKYIDIRRTKLKESKEFFP